jgi:seryl-tRNA synthetase
MLIICFLSVRLAGKFQLDKLRHQFGLLNKTLALAHKAQAAQKGAANTPVDIAKATVDITAIKTAIEHAEAECNAIELKVKTALGHVGNLVHDSVPVATDEVWFSSDLTLCSLCLF